MSVLRKFITLFIAFFLGASAGYLSYTQVLSIPDQALSNWVYDHAPKDSLDTHITIIAIDDASAAFCDADGVPARQTLAEVVSALSADGAAVIGLDLSLTQPSSDAAGDEALAEACGRAGNVIAPAIALYNGFYQPSEQELRSQAAYAESGKNWSEQEITTVLYPYSPLRENVSVGIANAAQKSQDGIVRNAALTADFRGESCDSFAVAVYKAYQTCLGEPCTLPSPDNDGLFGFNTLSSQLSNNIVSLPDFLAGQYDASLIEDSIVLVGEYNETFTSRLEDFINPGQEQQEILLQAALIQTLLHQDTIRNLSPLVQSILFAVLIACIYLLIASRKIWFTIAAPLILSVLLVNIGYVSNLLGYRFHLLVPLGFFIIDLLVSLLQRYVISVLDRKKMERTLKMYVEPEVVDQITSRSPFDLKRLSERKHVAILFVDIRGFTTISESLEPEQVVDILNEYLGMVADAIAYWNGTLDKFIGDAAMAIFNAPNDLDNYVLRAVCAANGIAHNADAIREKYEKRYGKTVSFGIGVNCGDAIVGNIGSFSRMDYTAIGDTVNTASRLEANAKAGQILVSREVYETVKDYVEATPIGPLSLKGKSKTVDTYQIDEITGLPGELLPKEGIFYDKFILHPKARPAR